MPIFDIETPHGKFQVDAPDMEAAAAAVKGAAAPHPGNKPSMLESIGQGIVTGLSFGFDDEIAAGVNTGFGFAGDYSKELEKQRALKKSAEEAHPVANTVSGVGGSVATLPLTGALNLVKVPSMISKSAPIVERGLNALQRGGANVANAGATGGAYGAAYGAGEGEGLAGKMAGAGTGAATGAAFGVAADPLRAVAGKVLTPVTNAFNSIFRSDTEAAKRVGTALQRDNGGASPSAALNASADAVEAGRAAGQPLIAADTGAEVTRGTMRSAANTSPEARTTIAGVTQDRFENQAERVTDIVRGITGTGGDTGGVKKAVEAAARKANQPAYDRAWNDPAAQAVWSPALEELTVSSTVRAAIKDSTKRASNDAAITGQRPFINPFIEAGDGSLTLKINKDGSQTLPGLQFWDAVKRNLDDAYKSAGPEEQRDILRLKEKLLSELDGTVPTYAQARATARKYFGAEDALEGGKLLARDRNIPNPDVARQISKMSPAERRLLEEGYANDLTQQVLGRGDNLHVGNASVFSNPVMRERAHLIFGPQKAGAIEAAVLTENLMNVTKNALGNSTTARQMVELGLAGGAGVIWGQGDITSPKTYIPAMLMFGAQRTGAKINGNLARKVGELLASGDPQQIRQAAQLVSQTPSLMGALRHAEDVMSKAFGPSAPEVGAGILGTLPGRAKQGEEQGGVGPVYNQPNRSPSRGGQGTQGKSSMMIPPFTPPDMRADYGGDPLAIALRRA